jgi:two-component system cell cycle response regulator DivK
MESCFATAEEPARPTVMVVDDFDDTRLMMKLWLEKKGYRVIEAENGNDAVRVAEAERPDLIIMDVEMPVADGLSATRRIRSLESLRAVPIIAVSAYGADEYQDRALQAGCNEYVSTPFEPVALEELMKNLLAAT